MREEPLLSIGEVAQRSGVSVTALRFYDDSGLVRAVRSGGNQRRYPRHVLRRLAFVSAAQRVGLTLGEIAEVLTELPTDRAPSAREWERVAAPWRARVQTRIDELQVLRDDLAGCIGCGCLSLQRCALLNPDDEAAAEGPGSRWQRRAARDT